MSEKLEKIFNDFISDVNDKQGVYYADGGNNENVPYFSNREGSCVFSEAILKKLGKKNFFKYTEYSLSSLYMSDDTISLEEDVNFETFINIITKASDVNNKYKWVDYYFKFDVKEEFNILTPRSENKDFLFRKYLEPNHLKNMSVLRKYEQGAILKTSEKNKVDTKIVSEYIVHDTYKNIIESLDYQLSHKIYTKAHIFHSKYGNSDHIIILVMRHYKDENFLHPLFHDRALVQIKSYSNYNKYSDITQKNLLNYAEIFKPYISLRKVDNNFVEQIKDSLSRTF
ncbi:hypothetical protein, conserved [Plasmodium gonderi]|uniref:Uncharacterized protein n=1 Tax=Plasmodium gonderi TaxID=77519 RepID=A0A1Y1JUC9_PLAGO|nr:hypothetical protein, conserved [Plasmodium gonderi]GAW83514.1 hypothetical protein, conserved [Plasmodium gonderi]